MEFDIEKLINRIQICMKDKGINQKQLAQKAGISIHTLGKVIRLETREPSISLIIAIVEALSVSADYLIYGSSKSDTTPFPLTFHEKEVITAYRKNPQFNEAIDAMLGINNPEKELHVGKMVAFGGTKTEKTPPSDITPEEFEGLYNEHEKKMLIKTLDEQEKKRK